MRFWRDVGEAMNSALRDQFAADINALFIAGSYARGRYPASVMSDIRGSWLGRYVP